MFRQGVAACLDNVTVESETPSDLRAWAHSVERRVVLLSVCTSEDWELLADLCRAPEGVVVIALLDDVSVANYLRAITAGAAGATSRAVSPAELRSVFRAAVEGSTLLPTAVVRALATGSTASSPASDHPSSQEIGWLRDLANGVSVVRIAESAGYSERMMFRLLRDLYARLGTRGRTEALMLARKRDWI
ncbi:DNA-binding response regulator [Lentzea sp. NPDC004789]